MALELQFHHLGLAASRPELAAQFLKTMGYEIGKSLYDPLQRVTLCLCRHPSKMPDIEIISATAAVGGSPTEETTPLESILRERTESIYHTCYQAPNRAKTLEALEKEGHRLITTTPPKPARLFPGATVSFHLVQGFGLIELLETPPLTSS